MTIHLPRLPPAAALATRRSVLDGLAGFADDTLWPWDDAAASAASGASGAATVEQQAPQAPPPPPSPQAILAAVAHFHGLTPADIASPSRVKRLVRARAAAAYELRERCATLTLKAIGALLGGRDHSTVIHLIETERERRRAARVAVAGEGTMDGSPKNAEPNHAR